MNRTSHLSSSLRLLGLLIFVASVTACFSDDTSGDDSDGGGGRGDTSSGGGDAASGADASDAGGNPTLDVPVVEDASADSSRPDTGGPDETGGTCVDIVECINALPASATQTDFEACVDEGSPTAQDQILAVISCIQSNCAEASEDEIQACQQEFCSAELAECLGEEPPPEPSGDASCRDTIDCFLTCRDQACANECIGEADSTGTANAAIEFYNCGVENCASATSAEGFLSCTEENCPDESTACE